MKRSERTIKHRKGPSTVVYLCGSRNASGDRAPKLARWRPLGERRAERLWEDSGSSSQTLKINFVHVRFIFVFPHVHYSANQLNTVAIFQSHPDTTSTREENFNLEPSKKRPPDSSFSTEPTTRKKPRLDSRSQPESNRTKFSLVLWRTPEWCGIVPHRLVAAQTCSRSNAFWRQICY
jgi:hypothetical protein